MLEFFGRENLEDFNANFMIMFEIWKSTERYLTQKRAESKGCDNGSKILLPSVKPIDIAQILGWTRETGLGERGGKVRKAKLLSPIARACYSVSLLIDRAGCDLKEFEGVSMAGCCLETYTRKLKLLWPLF